MVKVKICGLKNMEDVNAVNRHLPDYAGFVLALGSPRSLSIERAGQLCRELDRSIKRVGVFVDQDYDFIMRAVEGCGLDVIQLHGGEPQELCLRFSGVEVWKAVRVTGPAALSELDQWPVDALVLDGLKPGSGCAFDWSLLSGICLSHRIILAGGLNADNVRQAMTLIQPYGVDVSSGVESNGFKDEEKIRAFIESVRRNSCYGQ